MWVKHVQGFKCNLSKLDLFVVYCHTVGRNLIGGLRGQSVVSVINGCRMLTI